MGSSSQVIDGMVERCRDRDEAAWRELYDAHFEFVYRVACRLGTPASEVDDVVQDVFTVAYRRLDQFEGGRFSTWLFRICANLVAGRHRRRRVRAALARLWVRGDEPDAAESPRRDLERADAERQVQRVLERMSAKKRDVLVLFELEGLPAAEVAERVGCPEATVFTRLHHARRQFKSIATRLGLDTEGVDR